MHALGATMQCVLCLVRCVTRLLNLWAVVALLADLFWQVCSAQFLVMRNSLMNGCVVSEVPRGDTSPRACSLLSPPGVWTLAFHNFVVDIISTENERNHLCLRLWLLAALAMHERLTACCAAEKGSWHNHGG